MFNKSTLIKFSALTFFIYQGATTEAHQISISEKNPSVLTTRHNISWSDPFKEHQLLIINIAHSGNHSIVIHFKYPIQLPKSLTIEINGLDHIPLSLTATHDPHAYQSTISLRSGLNTIRLNNKEDGLKSNSISQISITGAQALASRGATLAYQTYEAEAGHTNGKISKPSRQFLTLSAEASGRRYVTLSKQGDYVEWTAKKAANTLTVRYSIPDAPAGGGIEQHLALYINNEKVKELRLTSKFAWIYGKYPFNNAPTNGNPHHFFDESNFKNIHIPQDAKLRLELDIPSKGQAYNIDFIELEQAPLPYTKPQGFISIADTGAIPNDNRDDTDAINKAIKQAQQQHKSVWIPPGNFLTHSKFTIKNIQIRGAGIWYSNISGTNGQGGFFAKGGRIVIADLTLSSDATERNDSSDAAAIEGVFGRGSLIQNIWVEHMKVGVWLSKGTEGLTIVDGRIRDTWADGINLAGGVTNTVVSQLNIRNTGDDSAAMWSMGSANINNSFINITAQLPMLANTYAIYGGTDNRIQGCLGIDTLYASAGIAISNRFNPVPFSGSVQIKDTDLIRTGGYEPTYQYSLGGIWVFTDNRPLNATIEINNTNITNSTNDGILISQKGQTKKISLSQVNINTAPGYGIEVMNTSGKGVLHQVSITNTKKKIQSTDKFIIK